MFAINLGGSVIIFRIKTNVLIISLRGKRKSVTGRNSIFRGSNTIFKGKKINLTMIFKATFRGRKRIFTKMWSIHLMGCMRRAGSLRLLLDNAV